ncbi:MAG: O-antigen ligase family protein [Chloroflexi bacterium]|nr:O-antigen ligase family protein [Chloroflexota bacterium]
MIILFVLAGLLSVKMAGNFGVANREFRVIVLEPALLYSLIRALKLSRHELKRLVDSFIFSSVAVSLIGIYQFVFTNWVIVGEGVRRVLAVYGSPNNLALYLDRGLPLVLALALFSRRSARAAEADAPDGGTRPQTGLTAAKRAWQRVGTPSALYALAAVPIAIALYLTYSRGSLLLGVPAGLIFIGLVSGRRVRLVIVAVAVAGVLALIPFSQTARFQSLFQEGTGTGFFRVSVWESGVAMIRDHPVFGVGLDNFLYQYPKYIQPDAWREPNLSHPHNIVLDFWVRLGILGVVVLAWTTIEFYRAGVRMLGSADRALVLGLMASMTAALAHGMIDAGYFYVDLAFVFMLTYAVVIELNSRGKPAHPD